MIVILLKSGTTPEEIKQVLSTAAKKLVRFFYIDGKNAGDEIKKINPKKIFFDGTCPKKTTHFINGLVKNNTIASGEHCVYVNQNANKNAADFKKTAVYATWYETSGLINKTIAA